MTSVLFGVPLTNLYLYQNVFGWYLICNLFALAVTRKCQKCQLCLFRKKKFSRTEPICSTVSALSILITIVFHARKILHASQPLREGTFIYYWENQSGFKTLQKSDKNMKALFRNYPGAVKFTCI